MRPFSIIAIIACVTACESKVDRYQRVTREHEMAYAENVHAKYQSDSIATLISSLPPGPSSVRSSLERAKDSVGMEWTKKSDREEKLAIELRLMAGSR